MTAVFLDTVGLLAVWDAPDQWHAAADAAYRNLLKQARPLVTTPAVLLECGNAAARRSYRPRVNVLRQALIEAGFLAGPTPQEEEEAWAAYGRRDGAGAGIVDQMSFVVMRRLGLTEAFTNDQHFRAAGFTALF